MPRFLKGSAPRSLSLLLTLLAGCAAGTAGSGVASDEDAQELRQKAVFLCEHQQLLAPVVSRFPEGVEPSDFIRQEDLDFIQRTPSLAAPTELDVPGLQAELARYVQCESGRLSVWGDLATVELRQLRPQWEDPLLRTPEVLAPTSPEQRRSALELWARQNPATVSYQHQLWFVRTPEGWRRDYSLPEEEALFSTHFAVPRCEGAPGVPGPGEGTGPAQVMGEPDDVVPFQNHMSAPRRLWGPRLELPPEAREQRVGGVGRARCTINREGRVKDCCVLKSLPLVDGPFVRSLLRSRYTPGLLDGQPIQLRYTFTLRLTPPR
ncbi:energy transducer TonB [Archangium gephyra]|uniref:energy transducer TonB n=1 Tax=Archangium gephyra TaxID=48 RepID=UPI0035D49F65